MEAGSLPGGAWPVMLTPFRDDRSIDWAGLDALVEWYLQTGIAGLFAVAQTSEMYTLSAEERLRLACHVVQRVAGRVPVVACGTFGRGFEEQRTSVQAMGETGISAVIAITSQVVAPGESDAVLIERLGMLAESTAGVSLGLYECPAPYKRLCTEEVVAAAAKSGRFVFMKDTSESPRAIAGKVGAAAGSPLKVYNAETSSVLESMRQGAHGFSGNSGNYYPELMQWLCDAARRGDARAEAVQRLMSVADAVVSSPLYPASAKYFISQVRGVPITPVCRVTTVALSEHDARLLAHLHEHLLTSDLPISIA